MFTLNLDAILTKVYEKADILLNAVQIIYELNFLFFGWMLVTGPVEFPRGNPIQLGKMLDAGH